MSAVYQKNIWTQPSKIYRLRHFINRMTYRGWLDRHELCILSFTFLPNHEHDHHQPLNVSSRILHTYTYSMWQNKITCISLTNKIHKTKQRSRRQLNLFGDSSMPLALHKIPLGGSLVRANIYKLYLLHSHARNSFINDIVIINYYHQVLL